MSAAPRTGGRSTGRIAAWVALLAGAAVIAALVVLVVRNWVTLLIVLAALAVAGAAGWEAVTRRGRLRPVAVAVAVAALVGAGAAMIARGAIDELVVVLVASFVFGWATQRAIRDSRRPDATAPPMTPGRAVLLMNPRSGGGKVERFQLVAEAKRRGIEPLLLRPGDDLRTLAREVAGSADVIGMAGGDGSQALVAQVAMEHGLAYVCVPAGTRNHLALDLGLDRDDVVGALDAFTSGIERSIDLAFVNDRIFVNNVSLGVYAEIVRSDAYRDAKRETVEKMLPELLGPRARPFDLRFARPDGGEHSSAQLLLVSNNPYVLDSLVGAGSRPRMDTGKLGIVAIEIKGAAQAAKLVSLEALSEVRLFEGWTEWSADTFQVDSGSPVAAGIDGEAVILDPPLRFTISPSLLRVLLPPSAVGLSPAALRPGLSVSTLGELWEIAAGRRLTVPSQSSIRSALRPTGRERFLAHPRRALLLGGALVAAVLVAALVVPTGPLAVESSWAELMRDIQTPAVERLALVFNDLGRGLGRALSLAAVGVVLLVARRWLALLAFAATEALTPSINFAIKQLVDRPRPPGGLIEPTSSSFPSGHAAYGGATAVALVLLFTVPGARRRLWWTLAALGIALMAWSRTYLQVHWLSDVVAGSMLGIGISLLVFCLAQLWDGRRPEPPSG